MCGGMPQSQSFGYGGSQGSPFQKSYQPFGGAKPFQSFDQNGGGFAPMQQPQSSMMPGSQMPQQQYPFMGRMRDFGGGQFGNLMFSQMPPQQQQAAYSIPPYGQPPAPPPPPPPPPPAPTPAPYTPPPTPTPTPAGPPAFIPGRAPWEQAPSWAGDPATDTTSQAYWAQHPNNANPGFWGAGSGPWTNWRG